MQLSGYDRDEKSEKKHTKAFSYLLSGVFPEAKKLVRDINNWEIFVLSVYQNKL